MQTIDIDTEGSVHALNVLEGESLIVETASGALQIYRFAETFIVSAAVGHYRLINQGHSPIKVIQAFLKEALFGAGAAYQRVIGITLGTGVRSSHLIVGMRQASGCGVPVP